MPLFPLRECVYSEAKPVLIDIYLRALERGESVAESIREEYNEYLRAQRKKYYDNDMALRCMAKNALLPEKEALMLAETARKQGKTELAGLLEGSAKETASLPKKTKTSASAEDKLWRSKKQRDGSLKITLYAGEETEVSVPATLRGLPVTAIGKAAFSPEAKDLKEELKGVRAKLRSLKVPEGIVSIEAFGPCPGLEELSLPDSLETRQPFPGLQELTALKTIHTSTKYYQKVRAFSGWPQVSFSIPGEVKDLGLAAFEGSALESITVPDTVEKLNDDLFAQCKRLKRVALPSGIRELPKRLFSSSGIEEFTIPLDVEAIRESAFLRSELTEIEIPGTVRTIGANAFGWCEKLKKVTIQPGVQEIGSKVQHPDGSEEMQGAFRYSAISDIEIPGTVRMIPEEAFCGCKNLKKAVLREGVEEIGEEAFFLCAELTEIHIPATATKIADGAFTGCGQTLKIYAPAGSYAQRYAEQNSISCVAE